MWPDLEDRSSVRGIAALPLPSCKFPRRACAGSGVCAPADRRPASFFLLFFSLFQEAGGDRETGRAPTIVALLFLMPSPRSAESKANSAGENQPVASFLCERDT